MKKKLTNKQKAAKKRLGVAIDHLFRANKEINDALADISRVTGASAAYRKIKHCFDDLGDAKLMLGQALHDEEFELDHEPNEYELRCGHGPKHGCGRGGR